MEKFKYEITREDGIHARPAGEFVNFAKKLGESTELFIKFGDKTANAKKLFEVMSLCLKKGSIAEFTIKQKCNDEKAIKPENNIKSPVSSNDENIVPDALESIKKKVLDFLQKNAWGKLCEITVE